MHFRRVRFPASSSRRARVSQPGRSPVLFPVTLQQIVRVIHFRRVRFPARSEIPPRGSREARFCDYPSVYRQGYALLASSIPGKQFPARRVSQPESPVFKLPYGIPLGLCTSGEFDSLQAVPGPGQSARKTCFQVTLQHTVRVMHFRRVRFPASSSRCESASPKALFSSYPTAYR